MITFFALIGIIYCVSLFWRAMILAQTHIDGVNEPGPRRPR